MGSKTPDGGYEPHDHTLESEKLSILGGEPRGVHISRDGDIGGGDDGGEADDGDGDGRKANDAREVELLTTTAASFSISAADEIECRGATKKKRRPKRKKVAKHTQQSSPPRIPVDHLFPEQFPKGEIQVYHSIGETTERIPAAEVRHDANLRYWNDDLFLANYRKAAEIHRQTRLWVQEAVKPGHNLHDVAEGIEDSVRALLDNAGLEPGSSRKSGLGFPTGICLNNQVAHYTPNPGQKPVVIQENDILTFDFGVQIDGWIVDSAFTMAFDSAYDNLLTAVKSATNAGIKTAGVDVRISDVSAAIQEVMESYEVELNGRTFPVKAVRGLTGHNIKQNRIHGGKSIPFVRNNDQTKMKEGEVFAIETFGSTGRGRVVDDIGVYGYSLNEDAPLNVPLPLSTAKRLHKTIRENFGTLPFCRRYLERTGVKSYLAGMNSLVSNGIVEQYSPLMDVKGSYSAQFEHTLLLRETHKEVFSRGPDY